METKEKKVRAKKAEKDKAKTIYVSGSPLKRLRKLKKAGATFCYYQTNRLTKIIEGNYRYAYGCGHGLKITELNRQKLLKRQMLERIINNNIQLQNIDTKKITYFKFCEFIKNMKVGEFFDGDICAFDINKAYYTVACNLGLISNEFYEECLELKKEERLRLIGVIATTKRYHYYENGKMVRREIKKEDERLVSAWNNIVYYVDSFMKELCEILGDKMLLYWFDGIYVKGKHSEIRPLVKIIEDKYSVVFKDEFVKSMYVAVEPKTGENYLGIEKLKDDKYEIKKFFLKFKESNKYEITN